MFSTSEYLYLFGARDPYDSIKASVFLSLALLLVFLARRNQRFFTLLFHSNKQIHKTRANLQLLLSDLQLLSSS